MYFGNLGPYIPRNTHFGGHPTLVNNLIAYWGLEEASGTRFDSHSSLNLQSSAITPTVVSGKAGSGVRILNDGDLVLVNATSRVKTTSSFTISLWLSTTSFSDTLLIARAYSDVGWEIVGVSGTSTVYAVLNATDSSTSTATSTNYTHAQFNHILAMFDGPNRTANISVNGQTLVTASATTGTTLLQGGNIEFGPGKTASQSVWDEIAIWQRLLTIDERNALYSSGVGRFY